MAAAMASQEGHAHYATGRDPSFVTVAFQTLLIPNDSVASVTFVLSSLGRIAALKYEELEDPGPSISNGPRTAG